MVVLWFLSIISISFSINFLNFILNKNNPIFYGVIVFLALISGMQYFGIFDISQYLGIVFYSFYSLGYTLIIPVLLVILLFKANYRMLKKNFYVDGAILAKKQSFSNYNLEFLNKFGKLSVFLKNDIKMITRNARPKQVYSCPFSSCFMD